MSEDELRKKAEWLAKTDGEAASSESLFRATVRMRQPWSDFWVKKPTVDDVLEAFADAIRNGEIDKIFQVEIRKVSCKVARWSSQG